MYGQKDYRGNNTERNFAQYLNGEFHDVDGTELLKALEKSSPVTGYEEKDTEANESNGRYVSQV